jgi:hypothetical protein
MDDDDIIILDENDDDLRNAVVVRSGRGRSRRTATSGARRPGRIIRTNGSRVRTVPRERERARFGDMDTGELVSTGLKVLTALEPLPAAPTAQGDAKTDLQNVITYQNNLAIHAKRVQQLNTIGEVIARLL